MTDLGRPEYTDIQYQTWLNDMAPFLKTGNSLYHAMDKAVLLQHKNVIYQKYRLNDWFRETCDIFQQYPGEMVNSIFNRLILSIDEKVNRGKSVTNEEWRNLRFFADRHRSCRPFFTNQQETVQTNFKNIGLIIDSLDQNTSPTDYDECTKMAGLQVEKMQMVMKLEGGSIKTQTTLEPIPSVLVQA